MRSLLIAFFTSFFSTLLIIRFNHLHKNLSGDNKPGPQKFHSHSVSRIGGVSIFLSLTVTVLYNSTKSFSYANTEILIFLSLIPIFLIGTLEDLTKKISVKARLIIISLSGLIAIQLLNILITNIDIPILNTLLSISFICYLFTTFSIVGLTNAYNIIDGLNGLASMVGIIALLAISYVAYKVNDSSIVTLSLSMIGAILGFFIWNFPRGLIFLGDGGAYLIGFFLALLSILLINRHQEISPWFPLLINAYPIFETLFTIWRRKFYKGKNPSLPDGAHFHSIIYRRIMRWATNEKSASTLAHRNAKTSPYLWLLSSLAVFPAMLYWQSSFILGSFFVIFCALYIWLYRSMVLFRTPKWLK